MIRNPRPRPKIIKTLYEFDEWWYSLSINKKEEIYNELKDIYEGNDK